MTNVETMAACGDQYFREGFFEAAVDSWGKALALRSAADTLPQIYDGLGKVAVKRERASEAVSWFDKALSIVPANNAEARAALSMRRAVALSLAGQRDIAFREAHELERNSSLLSIQRRGILLINLAGLEMSNGLYEATIESLQRAMAVLLPDHFVHYGYALSTNLGISYLELGQRDAARDWFEKALIVATGHPIHAVNGLAHTAMLEGRSDEMRHWSHEAFTAMSDSLMSFETEEMAHLTEVLGHMALYLGDGRLAVRLFDQAQNLYGHSGLWNRWRRLNRTIATADAPGYPQAGLSFRVSACPASCQKRRGHRIWSPVAVSSACCP